MILGERHKIVSPNKLRYNGVFIVSVIIVCCCRILLNCTSVKWAATVMGGRCVYVSTKLFIVTFLIIRPVIARD